VKSQNCVLCVQWPEVNVKKSQCFLSIEISSNKEVEKSGFFFLVKGLGFRVKGLPFPT
jgi:hypothetical protein